MKKNSVSRLMQPRFVNFLLPLLLGAALWLGAYIALPAADWGMPKQQFFTDWQQQIFPPHSFVSFLMGFLFVAVVAFMLFQANERFSYIRKRTALPFLFFVVLMGTNVQVLEFSFVHVSVLLLLLAINRLLAMQGQRMPVSEALGIGLTLAIGAVFNIELLFLLPFFWLGMWHLNCLNLRTFLASLMGLVVLVVPVAGVLFLVDAIPEGIAACRQNFSINFGLVQPHTTTIVYLVVLCTMVLFATIYLINHSFSEKIGTSRILHIITMLFVVCIALFAFTPEQRSDLFTFAALFASILYSHYFSLNEAKYTQVLFYVLLGICLIFYFVRLFV